MLSKSIERIDRWLDQVFFAAWEVSVLVIPTLWFLLAATPPEAVSLSGLTSLTVSALAVGTFRGEYFRTGAWPRPGHLPTLPIRSAYYSLVVGGTALLGSAVQVEFGAFWLGILVPVMCALPVLAAFPRALSRFESVSKLTL
ncbi:hypothetical protein C440_11708 [Haloferax mucosum ATCC BAA-1512]|uniref:DUF8215 domain-containing protein n=1 Tax=Haloferax mucosum ATCC BAA-1512 TaxID=662479 RepID=M0IBV5_9EURY|nr:hypothetical protein C440_11708 [Haloferax mucosum ATCC BAA-1512]